MFPACRVFQNLEPPDPQKFKAPRLIIPGFRPSEDDICMVNAQDTSIAERMRRRGVVIIL